MQTDRQKEFSSPYYSSSLSCEGEGRGEVAAPANEIIFPAPSPAKERAGVRFLVLLAAVLFLTSCGKEPPPQKQLQDIGDIAYTPERDKEIQRYNLNIRKERTAQRTPYDTIALMEYVIDNYPDGTYLVTSDEADASALPVPAVIYYNDKYVFTVLARSRPGERLIETKNIIGFDESFIDYDSTDLGTPFFDLLLFELRDNSFKLIWETPIPSHGGFNYMKLSRWKNSEKITINFYYAFKRGSIDFNYYLLNGITEPPHLMMTYTGINFKRSEADFNRDAFPDYYEHVYYDLDDRIIHRDSVPFVWKQNDRVYVNTVNRKQTRPY